MIPNGDRYSVNPNPNRVDKGTMEHEHEQEQEPDYEGEQYAEFVMSWVSGGGQTSDANEAWNCGIARNAGYLSAPEGNEERPYYMDMTPEEREADHLRFEMAMEMEDY
jgi:hypothetical protein